MSEENKQRRPSALARHYKNEEEIARLVLDPNTPPPIAAKLARGRPWLQVPAQEQRRALLGSSINKK